MTGYSRNKKHKKIEKRRRIKKFLFAVCIIIILLVLIFLMNRIESVEVVGNQHYSEAEIKKLMINGKLEQNAWYLFWKYKYMKTDEIPFIDTTEVSITGRGKVKIQVYEKKIVAYVEYLGRYMYFDKDGIVVESSEQAMDDVPLVSGLEFKKIILYEKLPVKKEKVFNSLLNLTQLLTKNKIHPDNIYYNENLEVTLYFGNVKVLLGKDENMNEKITRLSYLTSELEGRNGTLHMEKFNEDTRNITFQEGAVNK